MGRENSGARDRAHWVAAALAVAATYFYFLIFAEFAFLNLAETAVSGRLDLHWVMAGLGGGGIAGSMLAAWRFQPEGFYRRLAMAFFGSGLAALLALVVRSGLGMLAVAALVGLSLGWLTVTLSAGLKRMVGTAQLGRCVATGTGVAYALCNVPALFEADPSTQTVFAVSGVFIVGVMIRFFAVERIDDLPPITLSKGNSVRWILVFLALVWMDSAVFYVIQHTPLRVGMWSGTGQLWGNAAVHLALALLAGVLLDRGEQSRVALAAWATLGMACLLLQGGERQLSLAALLYSAGVSLYSAALVYFPAQVGQPWLAGAVFAVSGWLGSALGVGMAEKLNRVPWPLVAGAGVVVLAMVAWNKLAAKKSAD